MPVWLSSGEGSLPGCRLLFFPHMVGGERELFGFSFMRVLIPFIRALPPSPNHLLKAPPTHSITLGVTISTSEYWGHTNLQSLTNALTNLAP